MNEQLRKDKIKYIDMEVTEYLIKVFEKLLPLQKKARIKIVTKMKDDLTLFITKVICAENREEFEKVVEEGRK